MKVNRTQIALIAICALLILLTPLWVYMWKFSLNGLEKQPEKWGTFGDFIGGILNPIIALLTLGVTIVIAWELKKIEEKNSEKEISASYQPQLVLENSYFFVYPSSFYKLFKPTEFSAERKGSEYVSEMHSPNIFTVDVFNIGIGAAKDIEFKFSNNVTSLLRLIDDMSKKIPEERRIQLTYMENKRSYISIKYPSEMDTSFPVIFLPNTTIKLTHLLNVASSERPYKLILPHYYLELYTIYLYTFQQLMEKNENEKRDFPALPLEIKYSDIGIKEFKKNLQISFQIFQGSAREFKNVLMVEEFKS